MRTIQQSLERIETLLSLRVKEVLSVKEVAALLGKSESRIRHMASGREIPHYKNSQGKLSFLRKEIDDWLLGTKVLTNQELGIQASTRIALKRI